jgi:hypothetical protein
MEMPTSVAMGVANPSAQGQAMTITEIPTIRAVSKLPFQKYHPARVSRAMSKIILEKYPETVLASCSICGFLVMDSSRRLTMEVKREEETSLLAL